ncbi:MAG: CBS domain-containing protein [Nitrosarchaeum sp.]|nr:CBS domain-containing protein [Nitrosarchaeum sp.]
MKQKRQPKILRDIPVELQSIIKTPITIPLNTSILDARDILLRYGIGRLVVKFGKKAVGIITEKDIARSVSVFSGKPIEKIFVRDIMSKNLVTLLPNGSIYDCAKQMKNHGISSVIIQDKSQNLIGVITKTDLVSTFFDFVPAKTFDLHKEFAVPMEREEISSHQQLNEFNVNQMSYLLTFSAKDIMTKEPFVAYPDNDVYTAAILMIRHGISGIPVVRNQKLIGIVTKSDIVNVLASKGKLD